MFVFHSCFFVIVSICHDRSSLKNVIDFFYSCMGPYDLGEALTLNAPIKLVLALYKSSF